VPRNGKDGTILAGGTSAIGMFEGEPVFFRAAASVMVDATGIYVADHFSHFIIKFPTLVFWSPTLHRRLPKRTRDVVRTLLVGSLRQCNLAKLPREILLAVFTFVPS
jgi:hypothetical protein